VLDDELSAALEQVEQAGRTGRSVELVVLLDSNHREHPSLGAQCVASFGHSFFFGEQGNASRVPLVVAGNLGQSHATTLVSDEFRSVAVQPPVGGAAFGSPAAGARCCPNQAIIAW
jgi:hypothetical protein